MTGIDYLRQGPNIFNPKMFSGSAPPHIFARLWFVIGFAHYIQTAGMLKSQIDKDIFYTHRLEFTLFTKHCTIGLNEGIVNGSTINQSSDSIGSAFRVVERTWE